MQSEPKAKTIPANPKNKGLYRKKNFFFFNNKETYITGQIETELNFRIPIMVLFISLHIY